MKTKEERIRSARDSVVNAAKRLVAWDTTGSRLAVNWERLHRAVAYLNKLEAKR